MRSTLIVREIMQAFGKSQIYTNKCKKFRTVKCYIWEGFSDDTNARMINEIERKLTQLNIEHKIRTLENKYDTARTSIIVELPL